MTKDEFDQLIDSLRHRPVATTAAQMRQAAEELERLQYRHCTDCCCARSWRALGLEDAPYTGKSIPEHISELRAENDRLNMEMVAYRHKLTPKDVEAMTAVIKALTEGKQ